MVRPLNSLLRVVASVGVVAIVTFIYHFLLPVNPTTVALTYVVVVLTVASGWGGVEALAASVLATVCFNVFFLPPVGTIAIADPQNWVALAVFLVTAVVVSQLSGRARRQTCEAVARQRDLERLYALSRALLLSPARPTMAAAIARHVAESFEFDRVAVFDHRADALSWAGGGEDAPVESKLREAVRQGVSSQEGAMLVVPIQLGGVPIGALALPTGAMTDTVVQSIANLAAIGLERARGIEAEARAEAAQESGQLRATMLDAMAHEFKTPLTSMKVAAANLVATVTGDDNKELAAVIDEELDRLQSLVSDTVSTVRVDAGDFTLRLDRHPVADLVARSVSRFASRLDGHVVTTSVPEGLCIDADRALIGLALRQLLDNAVKYSPPNSTIRIAATDGDAVELSVHNSGSAIPEREQSRIFDRFYRGSQARRLPGTGMGLAIVRQVAEAHHGSVRVESAPGQGTRFIVSLPRKERAS